MWSGNQPSCILTTHLQALQHGRSCESLRHGSSIGISLGHIHSSNIKLDHSGSVTAAGGVGASTATGSSSGVSDAAGDDPRGISGGQPQLSSNTAGKGEGRCALRVDTTQLQLSTDQLAGVGGHWGHCWDAGKQGGGGWGRCNGDYSDS